MRKGKILMYDHMNKLFEELAADMQGIATTHTSNHLFNTKNASN